ncbi:MAG: RNB domain-containing ribonuclease [Phycisphaerae bacterium]|nr:RNB domain-containing ribonuclease [Gemmatimonadaceae bacterium]
MSHTFDLHAAAVRAMTEADFLPEFAPEALAEAKRVLPPFPSDHAPETADQRQDLRGLLWSSIDNKTSLDLDQVEVAEQLADGSIVIRVGIADVASVVPRDSAIDQHAAHNTSSVYTGVRTFAMLPEHLSNDVTSLRQGVDRAVIVIEFTVTPDGECGNHRVYAAFAHNHAKLDYIRVGAWLEQGERATSISSPEIEAQIRLQEEAARRLRAQRIRRGSLSFETIEAQPVVGADGKISIELVHKTRANNIIEDLMVTANVIIAGFLDEQNMPAIRRIVRKPDRWNRIVALAMAAGTTLPEEPDAAALAAFLADQQQQNPGGFADLSLSVVKLLGPGQYAVHHPADADEGHFGLATQYYTHSTAPNRRFGDLVTQRLLKAALHKQIAPYTIAELAELAEHCTERENAARKVERVVRKQAAAASLTDSVGQSFAAIVTGVTRNGTFVRVTLPPVEGRVIQGESGLDVGDHIKVRLESVDVAKGFIDFAAIRS